MLGTPGVGKTMLAKALPSILPPMTLNEAIETTEIYSSCNLNSQDEPVVVHRPFRSPHHGASSPAIIGGGTNPRPGEISLAHRGILFLDELPEFRKDVLEALRQPLEDGIVTVSRAKSSIAFPASFIFIASMNPCPCGFYKDSERECKCLPGEVLRYQKKISGPLLDRIDMQINVPRIKSEKIIHHELSDNTEELEKIKTRVVKARRLQEERLKKYKKYTNSEINSKESKEVVKIEEKATNLLKQSINKDLLSVRGYYKMLKVAQTIADIEESDTVTQAHVAEALQYRMKNIES